MYIYTYQMVFSYSVIQYPTIPGPNTRCSKCVTFEFSMEVWLFQGFLTSTLARIHQTGQVNWPRSTLCSQRALCDLLHIKTDRQIALERTEIPYNSIPPSTKGLEWGGGAPTTVATVWCFFHCIVDLWGLTIVDPPTWMHHIQPIPQDHWMLPFQTLQ